MTHCSLDLSKEQRISEVHFTRAHEHQSKIFCSSWEWKWLWGFVTSFTCIDKFLVFYFHCLWIFSCKRCYEKQEEWDVGYKDTEYLRVWKQEVLFTQFCFWRIVCTVTIYSAMQCQSLCSPRWTFWCSLILRVLIRGNSFFPA